MFEDEREWSSDEDHLVEALSTGDGAMVWVG